MAQERLLGIFTERDIVRLAAHGQALDHTPIAQVMSAPVITLSLADFQDLFAALFLFRRYNIRHLVIVDDQHHVVGVVSPESIRRILKPVNLLKIRRVAEVMTTSVIHVPPQTSVLEIAQRMTEAKISCIVITEVDEWEDLLSVILPVGIITERDIVQMQSLELNLANIPAEVVMSTPLFLLSPEDSLWTAHQEMQRRHVRRLVVSWDWRAKLGLVTQSSVLRVFDPIEMYTVLTSLASQDQPASVPPSLNDSQPQGQPRPPDLSGQIPVGLEPSLEALLQDLQDYLEGWLTTPDLSPAESKLRLQTALTRCQHLQQVLRGRSGGYSLRHNPDGL
jgi:signal-transduction protein with cAMP-binding, CBS, and nucleotidyltransferase domain